MDVDLTKYIEWTEKDCYEAEQQIEILYNRVMKLQDKLDKLALTPSQKETV